MNKQKTNLRFVVRLTILVLSASGLAAADEVTDWNRIMLDALRVPPAVAAPLAQRPAAMVQAAVFDAVNGIERRYTPIHVTPAAAPAHPNGPRRFRPLMQFWFGCFPAKRKRSTSSAVLP